VEASFRVNEVFTMRRAPAVLALSLLLATGAASFTGLSRASVKAQAATADGATFLIPQSDGYGVAECLSGKEECGKVVANAWCEAQGFARADSFGLAAPEDVTGSTERLSRSSATGRPFAITCAN
jgi:hypothetical protein